MAKFDVVRGDPQMVCVDGQPLTVCQAEAGARLLGVRPLTAEERAKCLARFGVRTETDTAHATA